ncbi:transposase [Nocardia asiatica]|uniref:transposase n=1 Tax=Nocardia asiatica TaxID=209252 RepID=UPI003EE1D689
MPKSFPPPMRRQVCARLRAGEPVAEVAAETGISPATLFRWKAQVLVDAGVREGIPSVEADELASAKKRIAALEAELKLTRDACELFDAQAVVSPKGGSRGRRRADRARTFGAVGLSNRWSAQIHLSAAAAAAVVHQNDSQDRGRL